MFLCIFNIIIFVFGLIVDNLKHLGNFHSPDTQTYIKKLEDERREKERGKGKDNRSFLAKYVSLNSML
jgi:hypothetical protein